MLSAPPLRGEKPDDPSGIKQSGRRMTMGNPLITETAEFASEEKRRAIERLFSDHIYGLLKHSNLIEEEAQRLFENGGDMGKEMEQQLLRIINRYRGGKRFIEEESSMPSPHFPEGFRIKSLSEQYEILRESLFLLPGIHGSSYRQSEARKPFPRGVQAGHHGHLLVPRWDTVAKDYREALRVIIEAIKERATSEEKEGMPLEGGISFLENAEAVWDEKTETALREIRKQQGNTHLVLPIQFGKEHAGCSVRRANERLRHNEFLLDPFSCLIMLLTHPERLGISGQSPKIDCGGVLFQSSQHGDLGYLSVSAVMDGWVRRLSLLGTDSFDKDSAPITGFMP